MDTSEPVETPARRAVRLRSEFVAAFVEHAGPVPASERRSVTFPTLITVTAVVLLLTLLVGVFWGLIRGDKDGKARVPSYTAFAGWGCAGAADHGFEPHGRTTQWRTVAQGGWATNGCNSTFQTIPLSGSDEDAGQQYVQWWFAPTTGNQCRVQVYVPKSSSPADTWATAAQYAVLSGRTGTAYANFTLDQSGSSGRWVDGGTFPLRGGELAVRLTNSGVPKRSGDRIAVSAMQVTCGG
ncbi:hypothetical protein O7617_00175 [Micromonospora sp. WMMD1155]|nr:hypothetical protein O7617_00175 [Micromonospora sp. WMMD1155]